MIFFLIFLSSCLTGNFKNSSFVFSKPFRSSKKEIYNTKVREPITREITEYVSNYHNGLIALVSTERNISSNIIKLLISSKGIDINHNQPGVGTALQIAFNKRDKETVENLIINGAKITFCVNGKNPIFYRAIMEGDLKYVKFLIKKGLSNRDPIDASVLSDFIFIDHSIDGNCTNPVERRRKIKEIIIYLSKNKDFDCIKELCVLKELNLKRADKNILEILLKRTLTHYKNAINRFNKTKKFSLDDLIRAKKLLNIMHCFEKFDSDEISDDLKEKNKKLELLSEELVEVCIDFLILTNNLDSGNYLNMLKEFKKAPKDIKYEITKWLSSI